MRGEWVKKGEEASPRGRSKFELGVKAWAGCSWEGKTRIHFIPKSMKGWEYLDFIKKKAEPDLLRLYPRKEKPPIWLQDGEGFHIAKVVKEYLKKSRIIPIADYPSHSPDLNWQENVWEMLRQGVRKRRPTTIEGLKKVVKEEWEKIPLSKIRKCISSMDKRLAAVRAAGGGNSKY